MEAKEQERLAAMRGSIAASSSGRPEDAIVIPKQFEEDFDELRVLEINSYVQGGVPGDGSVSDQNY